MSYQRHSTTIIIPCYNEAERLRMSAFSSFVQVQKEIRFLFVDDGSSDDTLDLLRQAAVEHDRIDVLALPENGGKAEAVRRGVLASLKCTTDYIGFWDADLATPLDAIPTFRNLLEERSQVDMVFGARVQLLGRQIVRNPLRHYVGRMFATVVSEMLRLRIYDTQCGAKLFRITPYLRFLFEEPFRAGWIFDVEVIARLKALQKVHTLRPLEELIYEYPLLAWRDIEGSKVSVRDYFKAVYQLYAIYTAYLGPAGLSFADPMELDGAPDETNSSGFDVMEIRERPTDPPLKGDRLSATTRRPIVFSDARRK